MQVNGLAHERWRIWSQVSVFGFGILEKVAGRKLRLTVM